MSSLYYSFCYFSLWKGSSVVWASPPSQCPLVRCSLIVLGKWSGFLNEWRKAKQSGGIQAARYGMPSFGFHRFQTGALIGKSGFRLLSIPSIAVRVEDKSILLFQARRVAHPSSLNPRRAKAGHVFYLLLWICQVIHRYLGKPRQSQCRINLLYLLKSLTPRKGTGLIFQVSPFLFQ